MDGIDDSDADNEAFGRGLAGSDGGEDDEMTALMRDSAALVGKKLAEKKQAGLKGAAADLRYEDFFGGKPGDEEAGDEETEDEEAESDEDEGKHGGACVRAVGIPCFCQASASPVIR